MKNDTLIRYPAEWEKHSATIIAWPANREDWPGKFTPIQWVYGEIVRYLATSEKVVVFVQDTSHKKSAERVLQKSRIDLNNVHFIIKKTDRGWMRDSSPTFVKKGKKVEGVHFLFNGWAKYDNWKLDKNVPGVLAKSLGMNMNIAQHKSSHVVLEGGAIDSNGAGTLLTTEECLLDEKTQTRNPGFAKKDYEEVFKKYLGIKKIVWLGKGIAGDDTHGHVDDLCRFVNEKTVVLCKEENSKEENYKLLNENFERLQSEKNATGDKLEVVTLPMPEPIIFDGMWVPASYANFYIANNVVLVPTFNDEKDRIALGILSELFPQRKVVGIHAGDLVWGLGTLHCLSHEIPA